MAYDEDGNFTGGISVFGGLQRSATELSPTANSSEGMQLQTPPAATSYINQAKTGEYDYTGSGSSSKMPVSNDMPASSSGANSNWVGSIIDVVKEIWNGVQGYKATETAGDQWNKSFNETKRRFDQTFFENVRQYNLDYALKEWATRKGVQLQDAQEVWKRYTEGRITDQNIRTSRLAEQKTRYDFEKEKKRDAKKQQFSKLFATSFAKAMSKRK